MPSEHTQSSLLNGLVFFVQDKVDRPFHETERETVIDMIWAHGGRVEDAPHYQKVTHIIVFPPDNQPPTGIGSAIPIPLNGRPIQHGNVERLFVPTGDKWSFKMLLDKFGTCHNKESAISFKKSQDWDWLREKTYLWSISNGPDGPFNSLFKPLLSYEWLHETIKRRKVSDLDSWWNGWLFRGIFVLDRLDDHRDSTRSAAGRKPMDSAAWFPDFQGRDDRNSPDRKSREERKSTQSRSHYRRRSRSPPPHQLDHYNEPHHRGQSHQQVTCPEASNVTTSSTATRRKTSSPTGKRFRRTTSPDSHNEESVDIVWLRSTEVPLPSPSSNICLPSPNIRPLFQGMEFHIISKQDDGSEQARLITLHGGTITNSAQYYVFPSRLLTQDYQQIIDALAGHPFKKAICADWIVESVKHNALLFLEPYILVSNPRAFHVQSLNQGISATQLSFSGRSLSFPFTISTTQLQTSTESPQSESTATGKSPVSAPNSLPSARGTIRKDPEPDRERPSGSVTAQKYPRKTIRNSANLGDVDVGATTTEKQKKLSSLFVPKSRSFKNLLGRRAPTMTKRKGAGKT